MTDKKTIVRAVTFRVATVDGADWKAFMDTLHACWQQSTDCFNFAVREMIKQDVSCAGGAKLPKVPERRGESIYLAAAECFHALPTNAVASITRAAESHYRSNRLGYFRGTLAPPLKRYPAPLPVHNQNWRPVWVNGERPGVRFVTGQPKRFRDGGTTVPDEAWTLVLSGGPGFARQLAMFRQIEGGQAKAGEMALYRQRAQGGDNRSGFTGGAPGGGQRVRYSVMCKLVAHFPRAERGPATGCLVLKTDPEAFWVAEHDGRVVRPWVLNGDEHLSWLAQSRHWQAAHAAFRQRLSEDMKLERRVRVGSRRQMQDALDNRCAKHRRRVKTWIDQACAQVVNYCVRQKVAALMYDDAERGWCESFPWFQVRTGLRHRCEAAGIACGGVLLNEEGCESEGAETAEVG